MATPRRIKPYTFGFGSVIGDVDGNAGIDGDDYSAVLSQFGRPGGGLAADFNADGGVDFTDFAALRQHYGASVLSPTPPAVPAPLAAAVSRSSFTYDAEDIDDPAAVPLVTGIPDLLFESSGVYVSPSRPVVSDSTAATLYRAATAESDLATISDESAYPGSGGLDDPLTDLLAEASARNIRL